MLDEQPVNLKVNGKVSVKGATQSKVEKVKFSYREEIRKQQKLTFGFPSASKLKVPSLPLIIVTPTLAADTQSGSSVEPA